MFPPRRIPPKQEQKDCEIEIKKTQHGKRIKFKGRCSREQIELLSKENGIDLEEGI